MRSRARFTIAFLFLQIVPIIAIGLITFAYTFKVVIDEVVDTSDLMTRQVYEQVHVALARTPGDPASVLRNDEALRELLGSMQAFGAAVVIARITDLDGKVLVAAGEGTEGQVPPQIPEVQALQKKVSPWWPFAVFSAFSGSDLYAATRTFNVGDKPFGTITIGVTTALLADRMKRLGVAFGLIVVADVILALLATASLRRLLFQEIRPFLPCLERHTCKVLLDSPSASRTNSADWRNDSIACPAPFIRAPWMETGRNRAFEVLRSIHDAVLVDSTGALLCQPRSAVGPWL